MTSLTALSNAPAVPNRMRRVEAVRAEYDRQKERGTRSNVIIADLAFRFFLEESTVESIVWKRGRYRQT